MSEKQRKPLLLVADKSLALAIAEKSETEAKSRSGSPNSRLDPTTAALLAGVTAGLFGGLVGTTVAGAALSGLLKKKPGDEVTADEAKAARDLFMNAGGLETISLLDAMSGDYVFPPGHPFPGHAYRLHPLAKARASKAKVYVPMSEFEAVLFKERESELIRLLTALGASRIELRESRGTNHRTHAGLSGSASGQGAKMALDHDSAAVEASSRVFELLGKQWTPTFQLNREQFGWLEFEPAWDSVVFARLVGCCTKATIELTKRSSFSLAASASVHTPVASGDFSASHAANVEESILVSAHFPGTAAPKVQS